MADQLKSSSTYSSALGEHPQKDTCITINQVNIKKINIKHGKTEIKNISSNRK